MAKKVIIGVGICIAAALVLAIGVAAGRSSAPSPKVAASSPTSRPTHYLKDGSWDNGSTTESPEPTPTEASYTPHKSDWELELKTKRKHCFGALDAM